MIVQLTSNILLRKNFSCNVKNIENYELIDTITVHNDVIKTSKVKIDLEGKCQLLWRQGVKHDCSKVMELELKNGEFMNKNNEKVFIEDTLVFLLVKSSHFKKPVIFEFSKYVIVTQNKPGQDTSYIKKKLP